MNLAKNQVSIIAALGTHTRIIGMKGDLPWHLSDDLRRFKEMTRAHPLIMGRTTWNSFPPRAREVTTRTHIVLTRDPAFSHPHAVSAHSMQSALAYARCMPGGDEIFIGGGAQVYEEALAHGYADRLYLTLVDSDAPGDCHFPDWRDSGYLKIIAENAPIIETGKPRYRYITVEK